MGGEKPLPAMTPMGRSSWLRTTWRQSTLCGTVGITTMRRRGSTTCKADTMTRRWAGLSVPIITPRLVRAWLGTNRSENPILPMLLPIGRCCFVSSTAAILCPERWYGAYAGLCRREIVRRRRSRRCLASKRSHGCSSPLLYVRPHSLCSRPFGRWGSRRSKSRICPAISSMSIVKSFLPQQLNKPKEPLSRHTLEEIKREANFKAQRISLYLASSPEYASFRYSPKITIATPAHLFVSYHIIRQFVKANILHRDANTISKER